MYSDYTVEKWLSLQQFWRRIVLWVSFLSLFVCIFSFFLTFELRIVFIEMIIIFLLFLSLVIDYFYFQRRIRKMLQHNSAHLDVWIAFYDDQLLLLEKFQEGVLEKNSIEYRYLKEQSPSYFLHQEASLKTKRSIFLLEKEYYEDYLQKIGRI